jgi:hypothetical protein
MFWRAFLLPFLIGALLLEKGRVLRLFMRDECALSMCKSLEYIRENRCVDPGVSDTVNNIVLLDNCTLLLYDAISKFQLFT